MQIIIHPDANFQPPSLEDALRPTHCSRCKTVFSPEKDDLLPFSRGDCYFYAHCPTCNILVQLSDTGHAAALRRIEEVLGTRRQADSPATQQPETTNTKDPNGSIR